MSSAGRSGTSDTERTNLPGGQGDLQGNFANMPPEMSSATGAQGPLMPDENAPEDKIEMVEIMEVGDLGDLEGDISEMEPGGFRWWYVPAIGLPVAVGAGAAIWYLTKGQEPYLNAWELVTRPVRNLTGQPRPAAKTKKAARKVGATSETLRDRLADTLGGFDATELAEKAGDLWDDARESMVDLWDQITDRGTRRRARGTARDAMQRQLGKVVGSVAAAGTALAIQKRMSELAGATQEKAQAARSTAQDTARRVTGRPAVRRRRMAFGLGAMGGAWLARNRAQAKAMQRRGRVWMMRRRAQSTVAGLTDTTGNLANRVKRQMALQGASAATKSTAKAVKFKSQRAMKQTRRRVMSPFRRMRGFAFAALVTAMVIYVRSWYSRRSSSTGDMRETAGGRMEPDTWPRFAGRARDAAMPTATNSPAEPS